MERRYLGYPDKEIRGCIDMGSSYFRLLVAGGFYPGDDLTIPADSTAKDEVHPWYGNNEQIFEDRVYVGWGESINKEQGEISAQFLDRAVRAMSELMSNAGKHSCPNPRVVATNTLRKADNAGEVISVVERRFNVRIHVLPAEYEAKLGFLGAVSGLPEDGCCMVFDPGGTSTEISVGKTFTFDEYLSIPLGTHQVRNLMCHTFTRKHIRYARLMIDEILMNNTSFMDEWWGYSCLSSGKKEVKILVTGGTAVSLVKVLGQMKNESQAYKELTSITLSEIEMVLRRIGERTEGEMIRLLPLERDRVKLFIPGLILLEALLRNMDIESFIVTKRDLRWGVILLGNKGWKEKYEG
jgi:exopolyphosphatase/guanosine-5'-triphosphate,3'-diphosphate pyrophosphatase